MVREVYGNLHFEERQIAPRKSGAGMDGGETCGDHVPKQRVDLFQPYAGWEPTSASTPFPTKGSSFPTLQRGDPMGR
jgi:hypothetical protein